MVPGEEDSWRLPADVFVATAFVCAASGAGASDLPRRPRAKLDADRHISHETPAACKGNLAQHARAIGKRLSPAVADQQCDVFGPVVPVGVLIGLGQWNVPEACEPVPCCRPRARARKAQLSRQEATDLG